MQIKTAAAYLKYIQFEKKNLRSQFASQGGQ